MSTHETRRRRALWVGLAVSVVIGIGWQFWPLRDASARTSRLQLRGPGYRGVDVPLTESEEHSFGGARALKRVYSVGSELCHLLVLDATRDRHAIHDPLYCFRGAGWSVESRHPFPLPGGEGALVRLARGDERTEALFWFSDGEDRFTGITEFWMRTTMRRVTLGLAGTEPVLVILQPWGDGPVSWRDVISRIPGILTL